MFDAIQDVWGTAGFRGFWKGIGPTLARAFPANAATFFVYNLGAFARKGNCWNVSFDNFPLFQSWRG